MTNTRHCTECGNKIEESLKFCGSCGHKIFQEKINKPPEVNSESLENVPSVNIPEKNKSKPTKKIAWIFFSPKGRLGRLNYFLFSLVIYIPLFSGSHATSLKETVEGYAGLTALAVIATLPLTIKRLHDINLPGWLAFLAGIINIFAVFMFLGAIINVIINLLLALWPGTKGRNNYGGDLS